MDQKLWGVLKPILLRVARSTPRLPRSCYSDYLILRLYFWAVLHDRPMSWAIEPTHYNCIFRPRQWPSVSQLNRRIASGRFTQMLKRVHELFRGDALAKMYTAYLDGKALLLSPVTTDQEATAGRIPGGFAKGYKLHALVDQSLQIPVFCVLPLNCHEQTAAHALLDQLQQLPRTLLLADTNYDSDKLYTQVHDKGGRLLTPLRGRATHPTTLSQMGSTRKQMIQFWNRRPAQMNRIYQKRKTIERVFSRLACTPGLLGHLPTFIRGLKRVERWVRAKICLYHARLRITPETKTKV